MHYYTYLLVLECPCGSVRVLEAVVHVDDADVIADGQPSAVAAAKLDSGDAGSGVVCPSVERRSGIDVELPHLAGPVDRGKRDTRFWGDDVDPAGVSHEAEILAVFADAKMFERPLCFLVAVHSADFLDGATKHVPFVHVSPSSGGENVVAVECRGLDRRVAQMQRRHEVVDFPVDMVDSERTVVASGHEKRLRLMETECLDGRP
ncbi:hypothetical protein OGATHE_005583 [Ogataea polymorpha]|uniref:Uncharacterized protein n=1 Tax=Ogataea polymorpha TaxID=460523 RepID=A0A9P8SY82_9ASCO|nr:hypothetical protein OGATHE_005583 [Ogataea polymorpha]